MIRRVGDRIRNSKPLTGLFLFLAVFLSTIISFAKEVVFSYFYGTTEIADAYTLAAQIPTTLFSIVSVSISTIIIPLYSKARYVDDEKPFVGFVNVFLSVVTLFTAFFVIAGIIFSDYLIYAFAPGFSATAHSTASLVLKIALGSVLLTNFTDAATGILNVHDRFFLPRLLSNVRVICSILFLVFLHQTIGVYAMAIGFMVGLATEVLLYLLYSKRFYSFKPSLDTKNILFRRALKMMLPVCIGIGGAEICALTNRLVASLLDTGSIAAISYATKLTTVFSAFSVSLVTTIGYPAISKSVSTDTKAGAANVFSSLFSATLYFAVPILIGGIIVSYNIVDVVYQRGAFTQENCLLVSSLLKWYLFAFFFTALSTMCNKYFYSLEDTKTPMIISLCTTVANIGTNFLFGIAFGWGVYGLALSTILKHATDLVISLIILYRRGALSKGMLFSVNNLKIITSGLLLILPVYLVSEVFSINKYLKLIVLLLLGAMVFLIGNGVLNERITMSLFSKAKHGLVSVLHKPGKNKDGCSGE